MNVKALLRTPRLALLVILSGGLTAYGHADSDTAAH